MMFDWIAVGFGFTFGAALFVLAVIVGLALLAAVAIGVLLAVGRVKRHNDRIRRRNEAAWSRCEGRWEAIANENRRLLREAQIAKVRPMLVHREKPRGKEWYGDPEENLRLHFPGARITTGGFYRP